MGVCIYAKNSSLDFNMGYAGFHRLRKSIADIIDPEFGELYHKFMAAYFPEDGFLAEQELNKYFVDKEEFFKPYEDILDFLFAPDTEGLANYKVCKKIYDLIKDKDFGKSGFQYVSYQYTLSNPQWVKAFYKNDYEAFKDFLKECYRYHRHMRWM